MYYFGAKFLQMNQPHLATYKTIGRGAYTVLSKDELNRIKSSVHDPLTAEQELQKVFTSLR